MLIGHLPDTLQDTTSIGILKSDTVAGNITISDTAKISVSDSVKPLSRKQIQINQVFSYDTVSVCERNPVADITYWRPDHIINVFGSYSESGFPLMFIDKNQKIRFRKREAVEKHLRSGDKLPEQQFHYDWNILVLTLSLLLFSVARSSGKSFIPGFARFYLFRGTGNDGAREVLGIFQWQATLLNLASFLIIALFSVFAARYLQINPEGITGFVFWLIILAAIVISITIRHLTCYLTGILSNQEDVFIDYLHTIYQSYRFSALFIFFISIMISYTDMVPEKSLFPAGAMVFAIHYLIRILRLFIIFINRNISIFYLILYLCALEILPVLIVIRFFSGLGY